jgi:hypothetical protein
MDEKAPSKIFRTLQILIPLVSVAVGIIGVLLTVAARKKELTCALVNSTRLVSENLGGIHPDMHVEFHGQPIFSLTKMTFDLRNTGAAAIMAKDVVEPVRLSFPATTKLMSATVERTFPADLKFSARVAPESRDVVLDFPLLNRGDEAIFSVYVLNSEAQKPNLEGRIVDVPQLVYAETNVSAARQNMWPFQSHATRSVVRWVLVIIYSALALLFLGICITGIGSYLKYLPWKHKWKHLYDGVIEELEKGRSAGSAADSHPIKTAGERLLTPEEAFRIKIAGEQRPTPSEAFALGTLRGHMLLFDDSFGEELKKRGIPGHPHPMVESLGGLAVLGASMFCLAVVCSTTAFVVYRALGG